MSTMKRVAFIGLLAFAPTLAQAQGLWGGSVGQNGVVTANHAACWAVSGYIKDCGAAPSTGTVTTVSVVSANGFAGTVATATTTPAITISTSITGILSGNGTAISATSTTGSGSVPLTAGTLTTTAGQTYTFPTTSATVARADSPTFTGNMQATGKLLLGSSGTPDELLSFAAGDGTKAQWYNTAGANFKFTVAMAANGGEHITRFGAPSAYTGPIFQWGQVSTSDGSTFTSLMALSGGGKLSVAGLASTGSGTGGHLVCADNAGALYTVAATTC